jgi:uncharacterized protein YeaO (DUF488 family)
MNGILRTARVYAPTEADLGGTITDAVRLLAVQRKWPPVPRAHYDRWVPALAPSAQLRANVAINKSMLGEDAAWKQYATDFRAEMLTRETSIAAFATVRELLADGRDVTLLCYCREPWRCHRSILWEMLTNG